MIACCGLECTKCEAFIATANDDDELREQTARQWSARYHADIRTEQINCTGCVPDGVKFVFCDKNCKIRKCCNPKPIETCAECDDYPCPTLQEFLQAAPEAKDALDARRK